MGIKQIHKRCIRDLGEGEAMTWTVRTLLVLTAVGFGGGADAKPRHPIYMICDNIACEQQLQKLEKQGKLKSKSCPLIEWHPDLGPWIPCVMAFPEGPGRLGPDGYHPRVNR